MPLCVDVLTCTTCCRRRAFPRLRVKFASLKREKKKLQLQLNKFKADFVADHGTAPASGDRQHLKKEFTRYKELKIQMKAVEDNPLFASFKLGQGQTM